MTTQLIPFTFESSTITVHIDESGAPWWVLKDLCAALSLSNPSKAASRLKPGETSTLTQSYSGGSTQLLLVNESGLYRLIMRSDKPDAERFQQWVFSEVLPAIRKTGRYEVPQASTAAPALPPPSQREQLESIELGAQLLEMFGGMTDRDKLLFQDCVRNVMFSDHKLLPQYTGSYGFSVAERVTTLGYRLDRRQQASFYPVLGKRLAAEYRLRHGTEPVKETRFVDGANRQVAWYASADAEWVDAIIQSFMASLDVHVREEV